MAMANERIPQAPYVLYVSTTLLLGAINSFTSPALPELEEQAHVDASGAGEIFLWRGIGSIGGALVSGFAVDTVRNPHLIMAFFFVVRACALVAMPYGWNRQLVALDLSIVAFCGNAIATCAATSITWTYGRLMGSRMNFMDSAFGIGGTLAPPLASFLAAVGSPIIHGFWTFACVDVCLLVASTLITARPNPQLAVSKVSAAKDALLAEEGERNSSEQLDETTRVRWSAVLLCAALVLFAGVCEGSLAFWCYTYGWQKLSLSPNNARTLNTVYWSGYTGTRLFLTWLARRTKPADILQGSVALALVAAVGMAMPSAEGSVFPCLALVGVGCGIAGLHANAIAMLRELSFISGRAQGCIRIGSSIGNMLGASSVGFLQHWPLIGRSALPVVINAGITMQIVILALLLYRVRSM